MKELEKIDIRETIEGELIRPKTIYFKLPERYGTEIDITKEVLELNTKTELQA